MMKEGTFLLLSTLLGLALPLAQQRVVIVGGGVGGLATAARLAASFDCTSSSTDEQKTTKPEIVILEKNEAVGGRCGSFHVNVPPYGVFRHERGPSLLLLPEIYERLFTDSGTTMDKFGLRFVPCDPAYQVVFDSGESIMVGFRRKKGEPMTEAELASRATMDSFEERGAEKWDEYLQACQAFLRCGLPNFIEERLDLQSFPAFLWEALRESGKAWPLKPHSDVLDAFFDSPKLKVLASFQDLYVGLEPWRNDNKLAGGVLETTAPAVFGLLAAIELHPENGVDAPIGGFGSVSTAMESLCLDLGVSIRCNQTVTSVSDVGVTVAADCGVQEIDADLVIVNADLPFVKKSLVVPNQAKTQQPESPRFDWDDKYRFSSGVISFHWSIDQKLDSLNAHNVFMQAGSDEDAKESWRCIRENPQGGTIFPESAKCNFYVHRPSKVDPTSAPEGCDSILVLLPCSTLKRQESFSQLDREAAMDGYAGQFTDEIIASARNVVLKRLSILEGLENLREHIVHETVDTPATMANAWNVGAGTPFGLSHGFKQLSITRPSSLASLPNTIFVGASAKPGNGVPLVLVGAEQAAKESIRILNEIRKSAQEEGALAAG